jgi:hypothetical protein
MPCSPRKARLLLKEKKTKVVHYEPFVIQLLIPTGETKQPVKIGVDLGAVHVGIAITTEDKILAKGEMELRQDVKGHLETRKMYCRSRRDRKTRYRRCKFKYKTRRFYHEKGARRKNRISHKTEVKHWTKEKVSFESLRQEGWLPPSIQSRMNNTFFWIDAFCSFVPAPQLALEVGKFDLQKMINPEIQGVHYQQGQTHGYHDVRYFVFARDHYTCQWCKKKNKILQTHHIVYQSNGGTDRADNLITLCTDCHTHENHQPGQILWKWMQEGKKLPAYKEGTFMNVFRRRVFKKYPQAKITYGSITTPHRKTLGLEKTHFNDAIAITGIQKMKENPKGLFLIKQFRKKKRSLHEATARKGRKTKNTTSKRNEKNTKQLNGFYLNDKVMVFGKIGFITGFTGTSMAYVKDVHDEYITIPDKKYKQIHLRDCRFVSHNNNWQFIPRLHCV